MIIETRDDVVRLEGRLDRNLWPAIEAAANLLLRGHPSGIIVDGSGLTGCAPDGVATFRDAMDYIERFSARIVVAALPADVMELVRAVPGIRSRLPLARTLDEARASLHLSGATRPSSEATSMSASGQSLLVALLSPDTARAAAQFALRLARAEGSKTKIHLVYFLEVPRDLPLGGALAEQEAEAARALDLAHEAGLTASPEVVRTREAGEEIVAEAARRGVSSILLTYIPADLSGDTDTQGKIARFVLERAPCEVILNRAAG